MPPRMTPASAEFDIAEWVLRRSCCVRRWGSRGKEEAQAEQVELSAPVHGAFEGLEPIDLSLSLSLAPGQADAGVTPLWWLWHTRDTAGKVAGLARSV